jgi:UDP-N-acetylglucosamine 2-epimerase (non-hydrolysing)
MSNKVSKYYFFIGTVAELIKVFPIMLDMEKRGIDYKIISSGQNKIEDSDIFKILKKDKIDVYLSSKKIKKSALGLLTWFIETFFKSVFQFRKLFSKDKNVNRYMIIHGDTVSTLMGAFLGKMFGFKVCHIEAGLRSFNLLQPFPEEIDRVLASKFVDLHFPPNEWAKRNLKKLKGDKVSTTNNTLLDGLVYALNSKVISNFLDQIKDEDFGVFVVHRQENLINKRLLEEVVQVVKEVSQNKKVLFILHEITKIAFQKYDLLKYIENNENIIIVDRLPYFELMHILQKAKFIVTDGGSNQEECYYLGLPTLILRNYSERQEGLGENAMLYKGNYNLIRDFCLNYESYRRESLIGVDYKSPSSIVVDYLTSL